MVLVLVVVTLIGEQHGYEQTAKGLVPAPLAVGNAVERPRPLPKVPLIDERGKPASLESFKGKWVVFAPAMTDCHEVCPMTTGAFMELEQDLKRSGLASHVVVAEVTVDPWRDHPARLRAYKRLTGADFTMLTGTVPNVLDLWKKLGILVERVPLEKPAPIDWYTHKPETLNILHGDGLFILDPAGQLRIVVGGMPKIEDGHNLEAPLYKLLDAEGIHNLRKPEAPWTASQLLEDLDWAMGREVPASSLQSTHAPSAHAAEEELSGSPSTLASLHRQASELIGSANALKHRIASLHGYPIVLNVWASWCGPCRQEFPLLAAASASFGRKVAFLGYDSNDEASSARAFLSKHHVSYPSYAGADTEIASITAIKGTPTTIYIAPDGKVANVHIGAYETQTTLNQDIERYALGLHQNVTGQRPSQA